MARYRNAKTDFLKMYVLSTTLIIIKKNYLHIRRASIYLKLMREYSDLTE